MNSVILLSEVLISSEQSVEAAQQMLAYAEKMRRVGNNTFDASPLKDIHPSGDWAAAGVLVSQAMHHLDESLPSGQLERTAAALGALRIGAQLMQTALGVRNVKPQYVSLLPANVHEQQQQANQAAT
jgi:hypothetical protein